MGSQLRVDVLGPLRLAVDGREVEVRGQRRRAALALLALAQGRVVTLDDLVDALWPQAPASGRAALHSQVSRLRGQLGPAADRLQTQQDGYRLELGADGLDAARARALLATARSSLPGDPAGALATLRQAHALWRGPLLADLVEIAPIAAAVQGHAHLRQEVTDALIAAALAAGQAEEVAGLALAEVAADPLREPAVLQHMRVLAATGRPADALRAGREYRARLADETGLDPSPALDELVREIAAGQPATRPATPAAPAVTRPATPAAPAVTRPATPAAPAAARLHGRDTDIAGLQRLLAQQRLVTLVGPGGVGKTRVAEEIAQSHPAATVLRLAPVTDPTAIPHALAAALGLAVVQGDVLAACTSVLAESTGLLVVDNCEHLLDAARATVTAILAACPALTVFATSREPLGLTAESLYRLPPLALPTDGTDPRTAPSVAVFLDRAGRVRPQAVEAIDIRRVADIVARLDGMPLAIELAAGRLSSFSVADLQERLDRSLDLLGGRPSGEARHATLRATIEWSYRLLSDGERRLFRFLSVFADGADLATAERLAADLGLAGEPGTDPGSVLARLVDASMVDVSFAGGQTRYRMLETLRAFGLDRLGARGETHEAGTHLLRWATELTTWIGATMESDREAEADATLRRELANLRTAWRLARDRADIDTRAAMVTSLFEAVAYRDLIELRDWATELAADPALPGHPRAGFVLAVAAEAAYHRGDYALAEELACRGLEQEPDADGRWYCLTVLSVVALARGEHARVVELSRAAAALRDPPRDNPGIDALALAYAGDLPAARAANQPGPGAAVSPSLRAWSSYVDAEIANCAGDTDEARRGYLAAIDLARGSGANFLVGIATVGLHSVQARSGATHDALRGYREVIDYFARTGNWTHLWTTLRNLADLLRQLGDPEPAGVLDAAADRAPDAPAAPGVPAVPPGPVPDRPDLLELARQAIARNLAAPPGTATPGGAGRGEG